MEEIYLPHGSIVFFVIATQRKRDLSFQTGDILLQHANALELEKMK